MKSIEKITKSNKHYSNQRGITLIALVVTIVVLLILAGVSINALFGNNGIIEKAKEAQSKMDEAKQNDLNALNELNNWLENEIGGEGTNIEGDYVVTFCDYNGTELKKVGVNKGETATYTGTTPTRASDENYNYTFSKWITTKGGHKEANLTNVQSNMEVYALYATQKVCFVAGTKVLTENGLMNIEDIQKGMKVYSYNEENEKVELNEVKTVFVNYVDYDMCKVYINGETIESTNKHPYYVKGKGWTEARYLQKGDILVTSENKEVKINNIEIVKHEGNELREVYNFEVNNNHNYFVGENKVLVHNPPALGYAAKIGEIVYPSISEAFAAVQAGETITLLKDVILDTSTACGTNGTISNTNLSNVTLDLSFFTLTIAAGNNVYLDNVTVVDSQSVGAINISTGATFVMNNTTTIPDTVTITDQN